MLEEPSARYEQIRIPLPEPVHGLEDVAAVVGIPEWWPTGARVAVAIAHGSASNLDDPLIAHLHRELAERRYLTLRFNFPFAEAGKRSSADSTAVLERTYRAAIAMMGRDPTAAPAHLFLGGTGLGARVAAHLATSRGVRVDGLFHLAFPLHTQDRPEQIHAEHLYRIIAPMLFVQGTRDRHCDLDTLRHALSRVGAPTALHVVEAADHHFKAAKKSGRGEEEIRTELLETITEWFEKIVHES